MITKFERKVIAGLTAFLMCLSMIFAVPVSVNAEAERTQDEAVSGVQQNETVKDVQIPDGMSENVPHDIIAGDEAGDVPHDITVGDEASEKVQQDTVEAGGAAKEKEDQPTAPYEEETRTPQMLNVDQQEEVAGTITLKKDGTPEYGEVAFSTEQTMVRYRLNIEEDGQYYFGLIKDWNVSAYVSLFERTDEGDNYLSNESYSYELRKDGNYYLEIEKSSEEALEVAFMGCESLKTVTIPESVKVIGREALGYLSSKQYEQGYKVEGFTIRGVAGSAAEKYAKENGFTFEAMKPDYIKGDSDSDGKVTISDVRTTLRYVCQKVELDEEQKLAADVEKDGVINIKDLRKVLRFVCNKIEEL